MSYIRGFVSVQCSLSFAPPVSHPGKTKGLVRPRSAGTCHVKSVAELRSWWSGVNHCSQGRGALDTSFATYCIQLGWQMQMSRLQILAVLMASHSAGASCCYGLQLIAYIGVYLTYLPCYAVIADPMLTGWEIFQESLETSARSTLASSTLIESPSSLADRIIQANSSHQRTSMRPSRHKSAADPRRSLIASPDGHAQSSNGSLSLTASTDVTLILKGEI